ncbi:hypothetical protein E4T38_06165 [Aureobasidium subglaciale]|nr:hypothetical protein E4T38_06165 [Aureobasidium subglaciale]KAI5219904.1 hypothetical protein E4T40_06186 [Aureobasidium subglaciale]KAI5223672.1 hypothetical protein E4T41_06011 [Aureobasidium subglaciale]KAI5260514.1 hypothetical protein E4T46_05920 [Aureobasidium subglaciale]
MGRKKKEAHDGKQTLKQAKAAFKARGSTLVTDTEKRQLERGAILLQRAERIKESETRRKEAKKKSLQDTKTTKTCLLSTQRVNDKFGYQRSQFHLGAFLKPKAVAPVAAPLPILQKEPPQEPWEDDGVDDDTLLDLAGESPITTLREPPVQAQAQQTPSKTHGSLKLESPLSTDDFGSWDDFLERSSQIAREISTERKPTPPATRSFDRIPSFTSTDFDLSVDDLEELERSVNDPPQQSDTPRSHIPQQVCRNSDVRSWLKKEGAHTHQKEGHDMDRKLMPPPMIPLKRPAPTCAETRKRLPSTKVAHEISLADLECLAGEDIQLSQFPLALITASWLKRLSSALLDANLAILIYKLQPEPDYSTVEIKEDEVPAAV